MNKHICLLAAIVLSVFEVGAFTLASIIAIKSNDFDSGCIAIMMMLLVAAGGGIAYCLCRLFKQTIKSASSESQSEQRNKLSHALLAEMVDLYKGKTKEEMGDIDGYFRDLMTILKDRIK